MKTTKAVFGILLITAALAGTANQTPAQSTYTPYAFNNFAGMPGVSGTNDGTGTVARFHSPFSVVVDSGGNVYVGDQSNHAIRKITAAGVVTTLAGLAGSPGSADGTGGTARFYGPSGVAVDSAGNLYVADQYNDTIRKVTAAGVVTTLAGLAGNIGSTDGTGSDARFHNPTGIAVDNAGNVYVTDQYNYTIREVTAAGVVTTLAGLAGNIGSTDGTGSDARFYDPNNIAVDNAGNLYLADQYNDTIRKITAAGVVTTLAGLAGIIGSTDGTGSDARFNLPAGMALDSAGNVFVADTLNHTIRRVTPAGVVTTLAGLAGNAGSADGSGSGARFDTPSGLALDSAGNVYVADGGNDLITKGTPPACVPHAATATATVVNGFVVGATVIDGGCGYTNTPTVRIIGGGGSGTEAGAVMTNGVIIAVNVLNAGSGFTYTPVIVIEPPFIPQPTMGIVSLPVIVGSTAQIMQLGFGNLSPYDSYQVQFTPIAGGTWTNFALPFIPTSAVSTQEVIASGNTGFFRLKYMP